MAKFCGNCGNPIEQDALFCDNCGARLDGSRSEKPTGSQPAQQEYYAQSPAQRVEPAAEQEGWKTVSYEHTPSSFKNKPSKQPSANKNGKLTALIVGVSVILLAAALIIFVVLPKLKDKSEPHNNTEETEEPIVSVETPAEPEPEILPDFEKYGIAADIKSGETFDVVTEVRDSGDIVIGKGRLESFTREPASREMVDFMSENGEDVDGYERLQASFVIEYTSSMIDGGSMRFKGIFFREIADYYNIDLFENSSETSMDTAGEEYTRCKVMYGGEEKNIYFWRDLYAELQGNTLYYHDVRTLLVPKGYDGIVCGYRDVRLPKAPVYENYSEGRYHFVRLTADGASAPIPENTNNASNASSNTDDALPYADSLGAPTDTDFVWIADAQSGGLYGNMLSKDDFIGKWKAEIIFDGVFELGTITIARDGAVTIAIYKVNTGTGWIDQTDEGEHILNGEFDCGGVGNIIATGNYGNLDLYWFIESYGVQYGQGNLIVPSGELGKVYLVRE